MANLRTYAYIVIFTAFFSLTTRHCLGEETNTFSSLLGRLYTPALRLESNGGSRTDAFQVTITMNSGKGHLATEIVAVTDGNRVAVLTRTTTGLPISYTTDGLHVRLNWDKPGRLLMKTDNSGALFVGIHDDGKPTVIVGTTDKPNTHLLLVDLWGILKAAEQRVKEAQWNEPGNQLTVRTGRSELTVALAADCQKECLIRELSFGSAVKGFGINGLEIAKITGTTIPKSLVTSTLTRSDLLNITKEQIEAIGLPIDPTDAIYEDQMLVPSNFGTNQLELEAAKKLKELFDK